MGDTNQQRVETIHPLLSSIKDCLYRVSVKGIVVHDGKLLMVRDNGDEYWGLPGGGIDYGEEIEPAFYRELKEEIGLEKEHIVAMKGPVLVTTQGIINRVPRINICYEVQIDVAQVKTGPDIDEYRWVDTEELGSLYVIPTLSGYVSTLQRYLADA